MDFNTYNAEELDLYDAYMKFANALIKAELKITTETIEPVTINTPKDLDEWIFTVKKYSYNKAELSKKFQKYLACADSEEVRELMPTYKESIHSIKVVSYKKWRTMVKRNEKLEQLLKNKNK